MRNTFMTNPALHGDKACDGSCAGERTDQQQQHHDSVNPNESADSNDSLTLNSPVGPDKHIHDQSAHQGSSGSKLTMNVSEAADWLGISRAFAYELVARGEIPSIRLGRRVLVPTKRLYALVLEEKT